MFSSITVAPAYDETSPKSSPPWVWLGFFFAAAFFVIEVLFVLMELDEPSINLVLTVISIGGWIYWLVCIHRFHKILAELSDGRYPIAPGEAAGRHIIPFYNLVWIFKWPAEMSNYINERGRVKMINGYLLGTILLFALLARFVDGAIGLAFLFATTLYISAKLKKHVAEVRGVDPNKLPPLPDPEMFRSRDTAPASNPVRTVQEPTVES
jgi:hypothetical protein